MSVDFGATVTVPFSVAAMVARAEATAAELLGLSVPAPRVVLDRARVMGRVAEPGRVPGPGELDRLLLGARRGASLPAIDVVDADGDTLLVPFESWSGSGGSRVIFTPQRDPASVFWALAFAVAAARLGRGRLVDDGLRLTDPLLADPDAFTEAARLPAYGGPFADAVRDFLGQFGALRGWLVP